MLHEIIVPELAESLELILPFGPTEGQSFLERVIKNVQPTWTKAAASSQFSTAQRQRVKARITADLAAHYYENGEVIDTETEWLEFEKEVDRRATAMLTVRMLGNLALPLSFTAQSPHYKVINGHKQMVEKYGLEEADEWLLDKHPDMFAILGRQTNDYFSPNPTTSQQLSKCIAYIGRNEYVRCNAIHSEGIQYH